jgi:hypothetical protein
MQKFFRSLAWYDLIPDQKHTFVTKGYGSFMTTGVNADNNYVTASLTRDRTLGIAYLPQQSTIEVDMARLRGTVTAKWFNPTTGQFTTIATYSATGSRAFTSPPPHSDGHDDWVLLLRAH